MKTTATQTPPSPRATQPAAPDRPRQPARSASDAVDHDAPHAPLNAAAASTPVPSMPSRRGLPLNASGATLRGQSLDKLRAGLPRRLRSNAADHAWALFATLPSEVSPEVSLHAAAYLQRLASAHAGDAPVAPYQGALDFMACVMLAHQVAGGRPQASKQKDWLVAFRTALDLHRAALGYEAALPAIDQPFVFAALESVNTRLGWAFKLPDTERLDAARTLRTRSEAAAPLTRLWDYADLNQPHEETFRKLLWQCLAG